MAGTAGGVTLWQDTGGSGDPILVLLHGLGANASVWDRLIPLIEQDWPGRWLRVDLRGHGRSPHAAPYAYAPYAADVAASITALAGKQDATVSVIGHSMGGLVAVALATGWFGVAVDRALAFGVKVRWTDEEIARGKQLGLAEVKWFDDRDAAIDRYLKVSGLIGLVDPGSDEAALGVREEGGRWRLASAPGINSAVGPDMADFCRVAQAPVRLAAGDRDPMVALDHLTPLDPEAVLWEGAGHNVHVERPDLVWSLFKELEG